MNPLDHYLPSNFKTDETRNAPNTSTSGDRPVKMVFEHLQKMMAPAKERSHHSVKKPPATEKNRTVAHTTEQNFQIEELDDLPLSDDIFHGIESLYKATTYEAAEQTIKTRMANIEAGAAGAQAEFQRVLDSLAHDFVRVDAKKASSAFYQYICHLEILGGIKTDKREEQQQLIQHAVQQLHDKLNLLTDNVKRECIREAYTNDYFRNMAQKVDLASPKAGLLKSLTEMAAYNDFERTIEHLGVAAGGGGGKGQPNQDDGYESDFDDEQKLQELRKQLELEASEARHRKLMDEVDAILAEGDAVLAGLTPEPAAHDESPTVQAQTAPSVSIAQVPKSKPLYPTVDEIRQITSERARTSAIHRFLDHCKDDAEQIQLNGFLEQLNAERAKKLNERIKAKYENPQTVTEQIKEVSKNLNLIAAAEKIAPPKKRTQEVEAINNKQPENTHNIALTLIELMNQPVRRSPRTEQACETDPRKWNQTELLQAFEGVKSQFSQKQQAMVRDHAGDIARLFRLEHFPFAWGYDSRRDIPVVSEAFNTMCWSLYSQFVGQPMFDKPTYQYVKRMDGSYQEKLMKGLFGNALFAAIKNKIANSDGQKLSSLKGQWLRGRIEHSESLQIAVYKNTRSNQYELLVGHNHSRPAQLTVQHGSLLERCLDIEQGQFHIFEAAGLSQPTFPMKVKYTFEK